MSQKPFEKIFNRERALFVFFSFLSILAPIAALIVPWRPEDIELGNWFSRSGAAMVVFALLAETKAINIFYIFRCVTISSSFI